MNSASFESSLGQVNAAGTNVAAKSNLARLPRLFKKTNTGAIQFWDIFVQESVTLPGAGEIVTIYGQLGTTSPQRTVDTIKEGKNPGKKNATTALEQAAKECLAKWQKQIKKGYAQTEDDARKELIDTTVIAGGIFPMLAHKYRDHAKKVVWPSFVQPKLNGHRCTAKVTGGKATLWSRKRKPITSMPHIIAELEANFVDAEFDGELFHPDVNQRSPDYKGKKSENPMTFQELGGLVRSKVPKGRFAMVQYHIYDLPVAGKKFVDRNDELIALLSQVDMSIICPVQTGLVKDDAGVQEIMTALRDLGYEGAMLRNAEGEYEFDKRSYDLLKVKKFEDDEFEIVGIEEGRGKLAGHVGAFVCKAKNGNLFKAKLDGETSYLKECFENPSLWTGKLLTVEYAELTDDEQVPFHGVGHDIRDKE